jgi:hypothetical protein
MARRAHLWPMQLDLTDQEVRALRLLIDAIEADCYLLSPCVRLLRVIRAKLPMAPPDPPQPKSDDAGGTRPKASAAVSVTAGQVIMGEVVPATNTTARPVDPTLDPNAPGAEGIRGDEGSPTARQPEALSDRQGPGDTGRDAARGFRDRPDRSGALSPAEKSSLRDREFESSSSARKC